MSILPIELENIVYNYKEQLCRSALLLDISIAALKMKYNRMEAFDYFDNYISMPLNEYQKLCDKHNAIAEDYLETVKAFKEDLAKKMKKDKEYYTKILNKHNY